MTSEEFKQLLREKTAEDIVENYLLTDEVGPYTSREALSVLERRARDVRFLLHVIITMLGGYFNRDDLFEQFLEDYNDHFPQRDEIAKRLTDCFDYIEECGFASKSRIWKRSDLFTALVQIDFALCAQTAPTPLQTLERLEAFYERVDAEGMESQTPAISMYAKASLQASNDRLNRTRRGVVFEAVMEGKDTTEALQSQGFI